jgi:hypothetical protein
MICGTLSRRPVAFPHAAAAARGAVRRPGSARRRGAHPAGGRARRAPAQTQRVAYAQGVLDIAAGSGDPGDEVLGVADLLDAGALAARHEAPDYQTMAERAAVDRTWTFGHVIVDDAQELSPMACRKPRAPDGSRSSCPTPG